MHNKEFDLRILLKTFKKVKIILALIGNDRWETVCTQDLAKKLEYPEKLEELCKLLNIEH